MRKNKWRITMLGDNIRRIRKSKRISINNLSKASGVSLGYLSDIENNKGVNPTKETLEKLAAALEVTVDEFFKEEPALSMTGVSPKASGSLSVKEQEKLDAEAEKMLADFRASLSQNKNQLSPADYEMLGATIRTLLEQMTKNNKEKYTPNKFKKNNSGDK
jgi:transcriptional regulator with XRE-family HTH domain